MPREMKQIEDTESYQGWLGAITADRLDRVSAIWSLSWGYADLYQIGYGRSEEYLISTRRQDQIGYTLWVGGKAETKRTWRTLVGHIAKSIP